MVSRVDGDSWYIQEYQLLSSMIERKGTDDFKRQRRTDESMNLES
jgi:hypothetical protein